MYGCRKSYRKFVVEFLCKLLKYEELCDFCLHKVVCRAKDSEIKISVKCQCSP